MNKMVVCFFVSIVFSTSPVFAQTPARGYLQLARSGKAAMSDSCRHTVFISSIALGENPGHRKFGDRALWLQGGVGGALSEINGRSQTSVLFFHGELSAHFRLQHKVISIGGFGDSTELWEMATLWATYGYSYARSWHESSVSLGVGYSQYREHPDIEKETTLSSDVPSLIFRAQTLAHLRQLLGLGLAFIGNVNRESSYLAGSVVFSLGLWNW